MNSRRMSLYLLLLFISFELLGCADDNIIEKIPSRGKINIMEILVSSRAGIIRVL